MAMRIILTENRAEELKAELSRAKKAALTAVGLQAGKNVRQITPVDTGRLRSSISHRLQGDSAVAIGTNVEYATYVEMGTSKMKKPHPYLRPGIENNAEQYRDIIKQYLSGG